MVNTEDVHAFTMTGNRVGTIADIRSQRDTISVSTMIPSHTTAQYRQPIGSIFEVGEERGLYLLLSEIVTIISYISSSRRSVDVEHDSDSLIKTFSTTVTH
jgi:hypothetical protein